MKGCEKMHNIIGGLLLVSLLSNPPLLIVGNALHQEREIVYVVNQREDGRLDGLLRLVTQNTKHITMLMQEKTRLIGQIETMMDLYSYEKKPLNQNQMTSFANLMSNYEAIDKNLAPALLHNEAADYDVFCNALDLFCAHQNKAIASLTGIVEESEKFLATF